MNDERRLHSAAAHHQATAAQSSEASGVTESPARAVICARCHHQPATTRRRCPTYVGTWGTPEPVCRSCADELDDLAERTLRGVLDVDRAVQRFHASRAA